MNSGILDAVDRTAKSLFPIAVELQRGTRSPAFASSVAMSGGGRRDDLIGCFFASGLGRAGQRLSLDQASSMGFTSREWGGR